MSHTLPKQLLIGNIPYEIKVVKGWIEENRTEILQGRIRYDEQLIEVSDNLPVEKFNKILLHEITHGILEEYGMVRHNKEDFVDRLSTALYDFLTRNDLSFLQPESRVVERNDMLDSFRYAIEKARETTTKTVSEAVSEQLTAVVKGESRPRQLPVINPGTSTFSLSELATIKKKEEEELNQEDEPEHWRTGIKVIDGEKHYKTRYQCPECGNKGTRYLPEDYQYVICHSCDGEIQKIPATKEGFPHRDSWGNYFVTAGVNTYERD